MSETEDQRKYRLARGKRIRSYGISVEDYESMLEEQNGTCWICNGTNDETALCIDHDHETNLVRGLLCNLCNRSLGLMNDDVNRLRRAVLYLESQPIHNAIKQIVANKEAVKKKKEQFEFNQALGIIKSFDRALKHEFGINALADYAEELEIVGLRQDAELFLNRHAPEQDLYE
jgi:hypothetical protein